jgi:hypothetical protein
LDEVGRKIQIAEDLRKKRIDAREELESKMNAASESIKIIVDQITAAAPLLQQAQEQSCDIERALRLLLDTQSRQSCHVVLQPVRETLHSEFKNVCSIKVSAQTLLSRRAFVVDEACMILTQVIVCVS